MPLKRFNRKKARISSAGDVQYDIPDKDSRLNASGRGWIKAEIHRTEFI
jgi:hypothetical protein